MIKSPEQITVTEQSVKKLYAIIPLEHEHKRLS